jgi:hypothetical protein
MVFKSIFKQYLNLKESYLWQNVKNLKAYKAGFTSH